MSAMKKILGLAGAALLATAIGASAATLSIVGGTAGTLGSKYNPLTPVAGLTGATAVTKFTVGNDGDSIDGLFLAGQAKVTVTFLGRESSAKDLFIETADMSGSFLSNKGAVGASITFDQTTAAAYLKFMFTTAFFNPAATITNGGVASKKELSIAFSDVFNGGKSVFAMFDDGGQGSNGLPDRDYDDMIVKIDVQSIPLPAGGLLLLTGLGGLVAARRRKA